METCQRTRKRERDRDCEDLAIFPATHLSLQEQITFHLPTSLFPLTFPLWVLTSLLQLQQLLEAEEEAPLGTVAAVPPDAIVAAVADTPVAAKERQNTAVEAVPRVAAGRLAAAAPLLLPAVVAAAAQRQQVPRSACASAVPSRLPNWMPLYY